MADIPYEPVVRDRQAERARAEEIPGYNEGRMEAAIEFRLLRQLLDANPSRIFGSIQANGIVVLANSSGFWFGPDSVVKAASFVATTAGGPPAGFCGT